MNTSESHYHVPFDTDEFKINIVQGHNGPYGHWKEKTGQKRDLRYAVDFALRPGTPVQAVRDGIVCGMWMKSKTYVDQHDFILGKQAMSKANMIILLHEDGDRSVCAHLEKDSEFVRMGEEVEAGQPIALSGLSGWVGDIPNVHIDVRREMKGILHTIPVLFQEIPYPLDHDYLMRRKRRMNESIPINRKIG